MYWRGCELKKPFPLEVSSAVCIFVSLSIDGRKEVHTHSKEVKLLSLRRKRLSTLSKEIIVKDNN
jgi:hypothetical protein